MIDICIPAYNESEVIARSVRMVEDALQKGSFDWQIIVADNGSVMVTDPIPFTIKNMR